ncbi:MAG TPA: VOC family protein [Lunatimonas sp.]|nr:VOC family protein [Lunatimonas sp.]
MKAVHIYLNFAGNTEEAFTFYQTVFGGDFTAKISYKDMPLGEMTPPENELDKIAHISLPLSKDLILMGSDMMESMGQSVSFGNNSYIFLALESKEELDDYFQKLVVNGTVEMAVGDVPWGSYFGSLWDQFGVGWILEYEYPQE